MADKPTSVESVLCSAVEIASPAQRATYLDEACGDDGDLRAEVERLLKAHARAGSFLGQPAAGDRPSDVLNALTESGGLPDAVTPLLGLSSGAAFGAALGMAVTVIPVQLSAFVFGLAAVGLSYYMARKNKQVSIVSLILSGIITNGIFTALLTIVQIMSDPFKLQGIVHWIMGNFQNASWEKFNIAIIPIAAGFIVLFILRWKLNVLALGDEEAASSGLNPPRLKAWILLATTLASSAAIAVSGIIGLYGLIIPHVVRMLFGVDNKSTLVLNLLLGGSFLVLIDNISRSMAGFEVPIGVFTMLIGAPFFIWLFKKSNIGWQQ